MKLKPYIETIVSVLMEGQKTEKFFHASNYDFIPGKVYVAKKTKGTFDKKLEKLFESLRPKNKYSRLGSFFLVKNKSMLSIAGGEASDTYVVEASKYSMHH